jgi:hypothetical protein
MSETLEGNEHEYEFFPSEKDISQIAWRVAIHVHIDLPLALYFSEG